MKNNPRYFASLGLPRGKVAEPRGKDETRSNGGCRNAGARPNFSNEADFSINIVYNNLRNLKNHRGFRALRHCAAALPAAIRRRGLPRTN